MSVLFAAFCLSACGGGGGNGGGNNPPPSNGQVTVAGKITFDRPPFATQLGSGLDMANPAESPARSVVVEAIDASSNAILASTTTDSAGDYSLLVPQNRSIFIRAKAQMLKSGTAPTWNFRVLNNTNGDALYALDGSAFNSGSTSTTRNLRAATGWGSTSYTGTRAAAPFAILDSVYQATGLVLSAEPTASFADLDLFWSSTNRAASPLCPDLGNIETSFYDSGGRDDRCSTPAEMPAGIYILGDFASGSGDTDEFDRHVIAHEFGHYYEDRFSRSDSIGGSHGESDRLDFRVAFGEGWGNAYAGMSLNDPVYRDSFSGIDSDFGFDIEDDFTDVEGWFSEMSASEIVWDIFDDATEPGDTVALGFAPIHGAMTTGQVTTNALTSIYTFSSAIRSGNSAASSSIAALLNNEDVSVTNEFGDGEQDSDGDSLALPVYGTIALNAAVNNVCTHGSGDGSSNKLGNRKFFVFVNDANRLVTFNTVGVAGPNGGIAASDPDIFVYRQGEMVGFGVSETDRAETISQLSLGAGTYIVEVYDFDITTTTDAATPHCMTLTITG